MKKGITTHVLDLSIGMPAIGIKVELYEITAQEKLLLSSGKTNVDGRVDEMLLESVHVGEFELLFYVEEYYKKKTERDSMFLTNIPIRFKTKENEVHYHIPLLISGWGYQTYRGS